MTMGKRRASGIERGMEFVAEQTFQLKEKLWMENLARNISNGMLINPDIRELPKLNGSAVVIGAGPSVERYDHLKLLKESGYGGTIVACDKILIPCLKAGLTPDIVITADGDPKIAEFYNHELVKQNGKTKAVLNVITHPETVTKVPYHVFWYMTPVDDPLAPRSITRCMHFMTKKTIFSSFGCVGGEAFNLAYFLGANPIILVGMDYGYPPDTPPEQTSYYGSYAELAKRQGKKVGDYFTTVRNPDTGNDVVLDMNWAIYRRLFLQQIKKAKVKIINCSPTSSLFGEGIEFIELKEVLEKWER